VQLVVAAQLTSKVFVNSPELPENVAVIVTIDMAIPLQVVDTHVQVPSSAPLPLPPPPSPPPPLPPLPHPRAQRQAAAIAQPRRSPIFIIFVIDSPFESLVLLRPMAATRELLCKRGGHEGATQADGEAVEGAQPVCHQTRY
jgi:hypothetical protein